MKKKCSLCNQEEAQAWLIMPDGKAYYRCSCCELVWLAPEFWVSPEREKARYLEHNNHLNDPKYLQYLRRLPDKMRPYLQSGAQGLDYGCGPVKGMDFILHAEGFTISSYDPIFFAEASLLERAYDFVLCSEVAEHFFTPLEQFQRLQTLLKKNGLLGISSHLYPSDKIAFAQWGYRRDPTHVVFYARKTVQYLADLFGWHILELESPLWLLRK